MVLDFVAEMPVPGGYKRPDDISTFFNIVFYTWVILQVFPVNICLVCEKLHGCGKDAFLEDFFCIYHLLEVSGVSIIYFLSS